MSEVRFATIGTSIITEAFTRALELAEGARLAGVYSRDLEHAEAFGEPRGAELFFDDLDDLASSSDIDAVYIASPNILHAPQALRMIAAGKAVLVEKPIATNLEETRKVLDAARDAGVVCMEAMRLAHDPGFLALADELGRVGQVRRVSLRKGQYSSRYDLVRRGEHTNMFDPKFATGALMDLGVYPLHALVRLFGQPDDLACMGLTVDVTGQGDLIDLLGSALLSYGGMVAEVAYGKVSRDVLGCEIEGERGTLTWEELGRPREVTFTDLDGASTVFSVGDDVLEEGLNMVYEIEDFAAAMAGSFDVEPTNRDSLVVAGIMETIRYREGIVFPTDPAEVRG